MHSKSRFNSSVISRRASGSGESAAASIAAGSSSIEFSLRLRTTSIARLRAMEAIQVIGEASAGLNWPALFQILTYVS